MKEFNRIISILFFVLSIISPLNVICDERSDKVKELEIRRNINKADLSNLKVVDFAWLNKSTGALGEFKFVEIKNTSILGFKNINIEVYIYDGKGALTTFFIPLNDLISANETKKFNSVTTPILPFQPTKTEISIRSAEISYDSRIFSFEAVDSIKILDFDYIIDDSVAKIIIVETLEIKNKSKNYYGNVQYRIDFMDPKQNIIASKKFLIKEPIAPGQSKTFKHFQVPGLPTEQFTNISLSVESGDLLSSKEYLVAGGDRKYVDETLLDIDIDDPPVPSRDLKIQNYSWANSAKHTIGNINVEISNGSRFKYDSVEIVLDFKTPRGTTLISRKVRINDYIDPYKEKLFLNVPIGYVDFDVTNLEIRVTNANMIGYVKTVEKAKKKPSYQSKQRTPKEVFEPGSGLIIIDYDIQNFGSIKIFNRDDVEISDIEVSIELFDQKDNLIKEYDIVINDIIMPGQEKTFRAINLPGVDQISFVYAKIQIGSAKRPK
ncbi:MAG: hypothetical protein VYB18_03040 [Thermodesulfobacteriota bacterium]|nr:hypothetical protein [Thermodesulfobacteriota bacterium]